MKPVSYAQLMARLHPDTHGRAVGDRDDHAKRRLDPVQAEADRLRGSARWKFVRRAKLRRSPLCEACLAAGVTTAACDVDHIVPVVELIRRGTPNDVFAPNAIQSLCRSCHNQKTALERAERKARTATLIENERLATQGTGRALIATQSAESDRTDGGRPDSREADTGGGRGRLWAPAVLRRAGGSASILAGFPPFPTIPPSPGSPGTSAPSGAPGGDFGHGRGTP